MPNLTITRAVSKPASGSTPECCYVQGTIDSRIRLCSCRFKATGTDGY